MQLFKEFRDFAVKGNAIDLAVGIILGAEFGKIVNSLVQDILMPPLGLLIGGIDFRNLFITLKRPPGHEEAFSTLAEAQRAGAVTLNVGQFLTVSLSFIIITFSVFLLVRTFNRLRSKL